MITINGRQISVTQTKLSYSDIATLIGGDATKSVYSITYMKPDGTGGMVIPGPMTIPVTEGLNIMCAKIKDLG